jgi:hypothetical protein
MGVALEVLGRKLEELGVFQGLHLVDQPDRNIHTVARAQLELYELFLRL